MRRSKQCSFEWRGPEDTDDIGGAVEANVWPPVYQVHRTLAIVVDLLESGGHFRERLEGLIHVCASVFLLLYQQSK